MFDHDLPFDPTYGYDEQALRRVGAPAEPDDFADFWRETFRAARQVPLKITRRDSPLSTDKVAVCEVEFDSLDGVRIGGWLTLPRRGRVERGVVVGHGYAGRELPDVVEDGAPVARIFFCFRGFHRSARPDIPNTSERHVLHGIESRKTYVHRGCAADIWAAASALLEMVPEAAASLHYDGSSFGGGIGALALPWDERFVSAHLGVPSFGNHPLRVTLPCVGSGESVRLYHQDHPGVLDMLAYFDSVTAAGHLTIPTLVSAALFDPAVPPPGQFAVYNNLAGEKALFIHQAAHFEFPGKDEEYVRRDAAIRDWFIAHRGRAV